MDKILKTNKTQLAIILLSVCISFISSNASALTFINSSTSDSGKSTKSNEIKIYDVEFSQALSKELLERIVAKTDYDFSQHNLANNISKRCALSIRPVAYGKAKEGEIELWNILIGTLSINSGVVTINESSRWRMKGLSKDKQYLNEFNVRLTKDGHFVGKMAFFLRRIQTGEPPELPYYPELTKHKNNKPFNNNMEQAEFWIDVEDWRGGVMYVEMCRNL